MKKLQPLLYMMILVIAVVTFPTHSFANKSFTDVTSKDNFSKHVQYIAGKGIIDGYEDGTFRPRNNITRAQAAKMLIEATGNQNVSVGNLVITGPTIPEQYNYLSKAVYLGYFKTGKNNYIDPNEVIKRDEIGYALAKAFKLSAAPSTNALMLTDIKDHPYVNELNGLYYAGITEGDNFAFMPNKNLSRAHFSMFLARAMNAEFKLNVKYPEQVADNLFIKIKTGSTATLNIRKEPNTSSSSSIVGSIPNGTVVQVLSITNGWYKVKHNNIEGYISSSYTEETTEKPEKPEPKPEPPAPTPIFKVIVQTGSSSTLNIRQQPNASTSSKIIGTLKNGTVVDVFATTNGWYKIKHNNQDGYISSSFTVKDDGSTPPTTPTPPPVGTTGKLMGKVTAPSLNVRSGPNTTSSIVSTVKRGQQIEVTALSGNWATVKVGSKTGYVSKIYLKLINQSSTPLKNRIIVIDAGHGGKDPGTSSRGLTEKSVTLAVAKRVEAKLKSAGANVKMTRSTDVYYNLGYRTNFAKQNFAESFVSIHVNSASPSALGAETFYDSKTNANGAESKVLANFVQQHIVKEASMVNRGIKDYGFHVVRENNVPAILVELGFITNTSDYNKLASNAYLDKYADAIYKGLVDYYSTN